MSFFDQKKIDNKAMENRQAERKAYINELIEIDKKEAMKKRDQEEMARLSAFAAEALEEFPSTALRVGTKTVKMTYPLDYVPVAMWPKYDVWLIPGLTFKGYKPFYINKNGKTYTDLDATSKLLVKCPRKEVIEGIAYSIRDSYYYGQRSQHPDTAFLDLPSITREKARELVEKKFMSFL